MSFLTSLFGTSSRTQPQTTLDAITYAAGLVSNPDSIDKMLDEVRFITADLAPGQQPSPEENATLLRVYLQIEHFLATQEPLRTFTKQELRARLAPELRTQIEAQDK